jgi:hypothetical protein
VSCGFLRSKKSPLGRAQGIGAESPQEAHGRFRGLAAESPVFLPALRGQKNAPKFRGFTLFFICDIL